MKLDKEYNLQDFELITFKPFVYRLFKGSLALEKIAGIFSYYCYDEEYKSRYVKVNE